MIEIYLLEQLTAVAKCKTLSAASEELHMTQPALSKSMQKLETILELNLFDRKKNRITINETGILAAELAEQILKQEENMIVQLRHFDKSKHTIALGSCAPIPISELVALLSEHYPHHTISSFLEEDEEKLVRDLLQEQYQLIVLSHTLKDENLYVQKYFKEQLYLLVPIGHPLSKYDFLHFADFDGQNILLHSKIGAWNEVARANLPNAHFMVMDSLDAIGNVFEIGAFPAFTTDYFINKLPANEDVKAIPILDDTATMQYYCICQNYNIKQLKNLFDLLVK